MDDLKPVKSHRKKKAGARVNKRKQKKHEELVDASKDFRDPARQARAAKELENQRKHNHKAFGVSKYGKANRRIQRNLDKGHQTEKITEVNRMKTTNPPAVVVVMGPKGCGKTTLIQSLVKKWTNQKLTLVQGPITIVTSKKKRVTLFECPNDINSMIDLAKIADLVLVMIDASVGFEMETFEFLNILQTHGFPKVIGVLTHLDGFRSGKRLQETKKKLKHRFWTEVYQGAKLFYLSGMIRGQYTKNEVHNLSLFISRVKFRPLRWRNSHPYVLVDRYEDVTDPAAVAADPLIDREVVMFGYMRGSNLRSNAKVHIPGAGDFTLDTLGSVSDPCPLPEKQTDENKKGRRSLSSKEIRMYAPMSNMGNVMYDQDAVYINVPKLHFTRGDAVGDDSDDNGAESDHGESADSDDETEERGRLDIVRSSGEPVPEGVGIVHQLQDVSVGIDERLQSSEVQLLRGVRLRRSTASGTDANRNEAGNDAQRRSEMRKEERSSEEEGDAEASTDESSSLSSESESDEETLRPLDVEGGSNLMRLVYGGDVDANSDTSDDSDGSSDDDGQLFRPKRRNTQRDESGEDDDGKEALFSKRKRIDRTIANVEHIADCSRMETSVGRLSSKWKSDDAIESLRNRFVTGNWDEENAEDSSANDSEEGTFEMLEEGSDAESNREDDVDDEEDGQDSVEKRGSDKSWREERDRKRAAERDRIRAEKAAAKKTFDAEYDVEKEENEENELLAAARRETDAQQKLNDSEFAELDREERERIEGVKSGRYVRVKLSGIPCEFFDHFDASKPLLLGGLLPHETAVGLVQMRMKCHRWFPKRLKCNDPLIFSIGWRRFQSLPLLSTKDQNSRMRMIKYTPEHLHCIATIYAPMVPPNTGVLAIQTLASDGATKSKHFSVAATGVVIELDRSFQVVKKLKLVGYPQKIYKKTAFIQDMFHSDLEVAKFEGAKLRTVSGIRGAIKKAQGSNGLFRATFEDKILRSDIVFCTTWVGVEPKRLYNPVCNHLVERCVQVREQDATASPSSSDAASTTERAWVGMRTTGQLRHAKSLNVPVEQDSFYRDIERKPRHFNPLKLPKSLQAKLPFASKPKILRKGANAEKRKQRKKKGVLAKLRRAVVYSKEEHRANRMMQKLRTVGHAMAKKRKEAKERQQAAYRKRKAKEDANRSAATKRKKKREYKMAGLEKLQRDRAAARRG